MKQRSFKDMAHLFDEEGFTKDPEEERKARRKIGEMPQACTPELLLQWLVTYAECPTLYEVKAYWGGILSVWVCAWQLMDEGKWPYGK